MTITEHSDILHNLPNADKVNQVIPSDLLVFKYSLKNLQGIKREIPAENTEEKNKRCEYVRMRANKGDNRHVAPPHGDMASCLHFQFAKSLYYPEKGRMELRCNPLSLSHTRTHTLR